MWRGCVLSMFVCLLALCGCNGKVPDAAKPLMALGAQAAAERAAAWTAIGDKIVSADPRYDAEVARFKADHGAGLQKQASALANLFAAVQLGADVKGALGDQVRFAADTATARAENFDRMRKYMTGPQEVVDFLSAHLAALQKQAATLNAIVALLPKPPPVTQ